MFAVAHAQLAELAVEVVVLAAGAARVGIGPLSANRGSIWLIRTGRVPGRTRGTAISTGPRGERDAWGGACVETLTPFAPYSRLGITIPGHAELIIRVAPCSLLFTKTLGGFLLFFLSPLIFIVLPMWVLDVCAIMWIDGIALGVPIF